jgi:hypothetical protein
MIWRAAHSGFEYFQREAGYMRTGSRWDSGTRCARCSPKPASSAAGLHKTANVLAALPNSAHPAAKKALPEIWGAEDK